MVGLSTWAGASSTTLLSVTDVGYTYYSHGRRERRLASGLDKGLVADVNLDYFVKRAGISRTISSVLQPAAGHNCYHWIIGYNGTSKTSVAEMSAPSWAVSFMLIFKQGQHLGNGLRTCWAQH